MDTYRGGGWNPLNWREGTYTATGANAKADALTKQAQDIRDANEKLIARQQSAQAAADKTLTDGQRAALDRTRRAEMYGGYQDLRATGQEFGDERGAQRRPAQGGTRTGRTAVRPGNRLPGGPAALGNGGVSGLRGLGPGGVRRAGVDASSKPAKVAVSARHDQRHPGPGAGGRGRSTARTSGPTRSKHTGPRVGCDRRPLRHPRQRLADPRRRRPPAAPPALGRRSGTQAAAAAADHRAT